MTKRSILSFLILATTVHSIFAQTSFAVSPLNRVGIGTDFPNSAFELVGDTTDVDFRISSSCGFCSTRLSFISDRGFNGEWRPGYIKSGDNGFFTGRLDFYTNGFGSDNKFGELHGMTVSNGRVGVNETSPQSALHIDGYTKLGDDAPKIKMKKFTGVTGSECDATFVNTGLSDVIILDVSILIGSSFKYGPNDHTGGRLFEYFVLNSTSPGLIATIEFILDCPISLGGSSGSSQIDNSPFTVLVTYEEN